MSKDKTIIIVSGPLGAGKSSLCKLIQSEFGFFYVDGDKFFVSLEDTSFSWEERLKHSWSWISDQAKKYIKNDENVVIDFVVKDELPWFLAQISQLDVQVKYVVLIANKDTIKQRLEQRDGGLQYFKRSMFLMDRLKEDPKNENYLLDTTGMTTEEVLVQIMNDKQFDIK